MTKHNFDHNGMYKLKSEINLIGNPEHRATT